jgi:hypothetical protein
MTLDEDDTTGVVPVSPRRPVPVAPEPGAGGPAAESVDPGSAGRRALREARRQRRRLMAVCAVIIAACLAMTVLIVGMARDRPVQDSPTGVIVHPVADLPTAPTPNRQRLTHHHRAVPPGAPAPEGGHP